jgi:hypothetical protein
MVQPVPLRVEVVIEPVHSGNHGGDARGIMQEV